MATQQQLLPLHQLLGGGGDYTALLELAELVVDNAKSHATTDPLRSSPSSSSCSSDDDDSATVRTCNSSKCKSNNKRTKKIKKKKKASTSNKSRWESVQIIHEKSLYSSPTMPLHLSLRRRTTRSIPKPTTPLHDTNNINNNNNSNNNLCRWESSPVKETNNNNNNNNDDGTLEENCNVTAASLSKLSLFSMPRRPPRRFSLDLDLDLVCCTSSHNDNNDNDEQKQQQYRHHHQPSTSELIDQALRDIECLSDSED